MNGARAAELIDRFDLSKSTIYSHLSTLEELGYIVREGDTYFLGLAFLPLSESARTRKRIYKLAKERVHQVASEMKAEVVFAVEENGRVISIIRDINYSFDEEFKQRYISYMHSTSVGKAILSAMPQSQIESVIDRWGLPKKGPNSISSRTELFEELEKISEQGFAINDEESREGFRAVGVVVRYPTGIPAGALSISGPKYRLTEDILPELVEDLQKHIDQLEDEIEANYTK